MSGSPDLSVAEAAAALDAAGVGAGAETDAPPVENPSAEEATDLTPAEEPKPAETPTEAEEADIETLPELAEHLGVDLTDLAPLKVAVGDEQKSIADLVADAQASAETASLREQVQQQHTALSAATQRQIAEYTQHAQKLKTELDTARGLVEQFENSVSPEQFPDMQSYGAALQQLKQARREVDARTEAARQDWDRTQQQHLQQIQQIQAQQLLAKVPTFNQPGVQQKTAQTLASLGYQPQEIGNILDHRVFAMAAELSDLRAGKTQAKAADTRKKTLRAAARAKKVQRPGGITQRAGAGEGSSTNSAEALQAAKTQLKKTGSVEAAARILQLRTGEP